MKKCKIGIIGAGTVGKSLVGMVREQKEIFFSKLGTEIEIIQIATRTPEKISSKVDCPVTTDWKGLIQNPEIDAIVELIGGVDVAFEIATMALENKKTFITANKALISEKGRELFALAEKNQVEIGYEAAVAGAIPIIRSLRDSLGSNRFEYVAGILNGTTNFILTKMEVEKLSYPQALKLAQDLGFAEADPSFDVEGIDVAQKTGILANLAFGRFFFSQKIKTKGITEVSDMDIENALSMGYRIKLLGIARETKGKILATVQPVLIALSHPLATIMNENNAVFYKTNFSGSGMVTGAGAGGNPTASAVMADILYYFSRRESILHNQNLLEKNLFPEADYDSSEDSDSRYYIRFTTVDKPGVLSEISKVLGNNGISISSVKQNESIENEPTNVLITTHLAKEKDILQSLETIDSNSSIIKEKTVSYPIIENL